MEFILTYFLLTGITTARSVDYLLQPHTLSEYDSLAAIRDDISLPNRTGLGAKVLSTSKARVTTPAIRGGVGEVLAVAGTTRLHDMRDSRAPLALSARGQSPLTSHHLNLHDVRKHRAPHTGSHGPLPADVRRSRHLGVANDAHGAGETLAPPPLETAALDGTLLDLAGDAVPVSIQLFAVSRVAPIQGSCSRLLCLLAVGKVHALLPRLRYGSRGRRTTAGLGLLFRCRLRL